MSGPYSEQQSSQTAIELTTIHGQRHSKPKSKAESWASRLTADHGPSRGSGWQSQGSMARMGLAEAGGGKPGEDDLPERLKLLNGFPRAARFLAADPNKSLMIVRRFDEVAIRNILHLEGRIAALEATQKVLDEDDYAIYRTNETLTEAASSWEHLEILGSDNVGDNAEALLDRWCSSRVAFLERKLLDDEKYPENLRDSNYPRRRRAVEKYREVQTEIESIENQLNEWSHEDESPYEWIQRRESLIKEHRRLINSKRYFLGYDEREILEVRKRWEVSRQLEASLKQYQDAVFRYRDMLKLEEPADRSDSVLSQWMLGKMQTNPGTQKASRQFLPGSALDMVYQPGPTRQRSFLSPVRKPERGGSVLDRVGIGRTGSADQLSKLISRVKPILRLGRDPNFEYPEVNYTPEVFLHKLVTFIVLALSAVLVIGAIWFLWLTQIKQPYQSVQLALLTFFIIAFGFALNFMTTATRDQVFGATAAYAAVLVVFVSSNLAPGNSTTTSSSS